MIAIDTKKFVLDYWDAISGKPKTPEVMDRFIADPEFKDHLKTFETAFPKYRLVPEDFICEDEKVVVRARCLGEHNGDLLGIAPTGKTIDLPFMVIYKINDDKIVKGWLSYDRMDLMGQLGLMPNN